MNPKGKNKKTQKCLKQKIMLLCYQMAGLRNKQVSGAKTAVGLFFVKSGASAHCVNTVANMGLYAQVEEAPLSKIQKMQIPHFPGKWPFAPLHGTQGPLALSALQLRSFAFRPGLSPAVQPGLSPGKIAFRPGLSPAFRSGLSPAFRSGLSPAFRSGLSPAFRFGLSPGID
ncbi:hypothetical protein RhiirB3_448621 [Rhizophagus irregularis]|nr:hypothetical protein RhiirB3_448621 [Rhizophagus irregularis]